MSVWLDNHVAKRAMMLALVTYKGNVTGHVVKAYKVLHVMLDSMYQELLVLI
jgi:hypothetical protein